MVSVGDNLIPPSMSKGAGFKEKGLCRERGDPRNAFPEVYLRKAEIHLSAVQHLCHPVCRIGFKFVNARMVLTPGMLAMPAPWQRFPVSSLSGPWGNKVPP
jgi:hypothetical protein